jgi:E3 ubiquitin-protein ligase HUWE1
VFQPNKDSAVNPEHLSYFTFCGRIVGKALHDGQLLDAYFTRSFYKHMLRQPTTYEDIETIDPDYYSALKWMLENDITGVLDLTFVAEEDYFGAKTVVELKEGGAAIAVTEDNKREYVHLVTAHRMTGAIRQQTEAFTRGFHDLVPHELVAPFNAAELELLISGLPEIDVDDLQANTEYTGYTPASPTIIWFWAVVRGLSREDLARFVMFVTGSSKVPLGGFAALQGIAGPQRMQIHRAYGGGARLMTAHTCFNQLDLPEAESMDELRERLLMAIHEGGEGFGFA